MQKIQEQKNPNPVVEVFKVLDPMRPLAIPTGTTKFERRADRVATTLWLFGGLMLSCMGFLAIGLLISDSDPAPEYLLNPFKVIAILGLLSGALGALLFFASMVVSLVRS